jgi:hypothetical protein
MQGNTPYGDLGGWVEWPLRATYGAHSSMEYHYGNVAVYTMSPRRSQCCLTILCLERKAFLQQEYDFYSKPNRKELIGNE